VKVVIYGLVFVGGVATGLFIAKQYARAQVGDAIHKGLDEFGLGGGVLEDTAKRLLIPVVV